MPTIKTLKSYMILDSRGLPTVQVSVQVEENGQEYRAVASVPSGASTGSHEALELRDGGSDYMGKGVSKAIDNVNSIIAPELIGKSFGSARDIDVVMLQLDGTANKTHLGANAVLGVSMAMHRAFAGSTGKELYHYLAELYFPDQVASLQRGQIQFPRWMCNVINGGVHADSGLSIQEFMIVPNGGDLLLDVKIAAEVYQNLKKILKNSGQVTAVGDEGGYAPKIPTSTEVLDTINQAIEKAGYSDQCEIALDVAASEFYGKSITAGMGTVDQSNKYFYQDKVLDAAGLLAVYQDLISKYRLISIEDGFFEDDLPAWKAMTEALGAQTMLVGDDLFVTNSKRLQEIGIDQKIANSILIKLNQIGTVSETCLTIDLAQKHNIKTVISHRSGETTDSFIADLAVASKSPFLKTGAVSRGERLVKINRLLQIYNA